MKFGTEIRNQNVRFSFNYFMSPSLSLSSSRYCGDNPALYIRGRNVSMLETKVNTVFKLITTAAQVHCPTPYKRL